MTRVLSFALLFASLTLNSCAAYKAQHAAPPPLAAPASAGEHPQTQRLSADEPLDSKRIVIAEQLSILKQELAAEGKYDCCVRPGCGECVLNAGECHCRRVVEKDGPCCGECTQAWIEGRGIVQGVNVEDILEHLGCLRELYEKKVPEGEKAPGAIVNP